MLLIMRCRSRIRSAAALYAANQHFLCTPQTISCSNPKKSPHADIQALTLHTCCWACAERNKSLGLCAHKRHQSVSHHR